MRRLLSGQLEDLSADLRPVGAFRTLPAIAVAIALGGCRAQVAPQPSVAGEDGSVFREGCDTGLCWSEGRDASGRLLNRREETAQGSTAWVYDPPGTLARPSLPSMYTNCGNGFNTDPVTNQLCNNCPNGGPMIQQGSPDGRGYYCNYTNQVAGDGAGPYTFVDGPGTGCFFPQANVWYTYYEKIFIGAYNGTTTTVDAYVAVDGGPYVQFQRAQRFPSAAETTISPWCAWKRT